jgi:hypothetical protein
MLHSRVQALAASKASPRRTYRTAPTDRKKASALELLVRVRVPTLGAQLLGSPEPGVRFERPQL